VNWGIYGNHYPVNCRFTPFKAQLSQAGQDVGRDGFLNSKKKDDDASHVVPRGLDAENMMRII
jgi:hypothetical protein